MTVVAVLGRRRSWASSGGAWRLRIARRDGRQHRLPASTSATDPGSDFPGLRVSKFVRSVTTTQVVLGTGGAAAVAMWLLGWRQQAVVLVAGWG
jgi:hypothetical protein